MCLNILPTIMGLLLIGGANGALAGSDVRILERTGRTVSVTGIGNHELPGLDIVTCAALLHTNHGKKILIMNEYAYYGRGNTIHSPGQIEWFQNTCDDKSFHVGGKQAITFLDGYATPLQCRTGLMYMNLLGKPTDADLNTFPHVLLAGPHEWEPSVVDYTHPTTAGDPIWAPFYQPVFYATHNQSYPSVSEDRAAQWVGFGEHVGDALTHKHLDDNTKKILTRSAVRPSDSAHPNKRLVPDGGESSKTPKPIVFVRSRQDDSQSATKPMAEYNPDDLIGRTFLLPKNEQGERLRATIKRKVIEASKHLDDQHDNAIEKINFHLDVGQG